MRVAVTGASGFVGGAIARHLAGQGFEVVTFGRRPATALGAQLPNYREWDVTAGPNETTDIDAVVHCAAHVGQWGDEGAYRAVNVEGTRHVLASFEKAACFVHISSSSAYASGQPKVHLREDAPLGEPALTPYARTKAEGERVVRASGREAIILRPHIVYGPGDTTLWPKVRRSVRLGVLPVPGDGTNRLSVTHVGNLALAVERALDVRPHSAAYNITDGVDATVDELLQTILQRQGVNARLLYIGRALAWRVAAFGELLAQSLGSAREPTLTRYVVANLADECTLDITAARTHLGYEPRCSFRNGAL